MAAVFKFQEDESTYFYTWHVGNTLEIVIEKLALLVDVTIDGHEANPLYEKEFELNGNRVHTLSTNESKLYAMYQHERMKLALYELSVEANLNQILSLLKK